MRITRRDTWVPPYNGFPVRTHPPCDFVGDGIPDVPTARSAVIPSQCEHWRGNPHPLPAGADNSPALLHASPCDSVGDGVPDAPPRPQARNLPFLPPAGDFCQQRQKSPKTPLETAFQDFLTRVGCDFALTCPTRNRFPGFSRFKGLCLHSFPRCAVARRCPLPRWVPWCSTARVPVDIPSRRTTLSARTHTPCRAGPMCPAAHRCGDLSARPRRGRRPRRPYSAKRCHSEPVRTLA